MAGLRHIGPFVPNYPFANKGDLTHIIVSQPYEVPTGEYVPDALNTTRTFSIGGSDKTLYCVGDTPSASSDQKFQRFTRQWANVPADRSEYETHVVTFPGLQNLVYEPILVGGANVWRDNGRREAYTKEVLSRVDYTYTRLTGTPLNPAAITLLDAQEYIWNRSSTRMSPTEIYLSDQDTFNSSYGVAAIWRATTPTRTAYFALGAYGLVVSCTVRRYRGSIYVRETRRVTPL